MLIKKELVEIKPLGPPTGIIFHPAFYDSTLKAYMLRKKQRERKEKLKKINDEILLQNTCE
jgi:hypothetical protein